MGHTCPDCGQMCYCNGDIDDIDWGEWIGCNHYLECNKEENPDYDDYDDEPCE